MSLSLKWEVSLPLEEVHIWGEVLFSTLENAPHTLLSGDGGCALAESIECVLPKKKLTLLLSSYISNCLECWLVTNICSHIKKTLKY